MLASIHFDFHEIGWDAAVAVGTLLLALMTGGLAWFTSRLASKTADLATDTAAEVRAGVRPVLLLEIEDYRPVFSADDDVLRLRLYNAGQGPALNAYAYATVATSAESVRSDNRRVGSIADGRWGEAQFAGLPATDQGNDPDRAYLAAHVVVVYSDLAGRTFHTEIGLLDPKKGQPITQAQPGPPPSRLLLLEGTEVGEGDAPPPQWRVTFAGPDISDDQRDRLRAAAVLLFGSHSVGMTSGPEPPTPTWWQWSAYASGSNPDEAIRRARDALDDERFVAWQATLWTAGRL